MTIVNQTAVVIFTTIEVKIFPSSTYLVDNHKMR